MELHHNRVILLKGQMVVDLISHCKIRVGKGTGTSFWKDLWIGDNLLKLSFPRLFALEENKDNIGCLMIRDWFGILNGDGVSIKDVRSMLDEAFLPKMEVPTRWIKRNVSLPSLASPLCDHRCSWIRPIFLRLLCGESYSEVIVDGGIWNVHPYECTKIAYWFKSKPFSLIERGVGRRVLRFLVEPLELQEPIPFCVHALETTFSGLRDQVSGYERLKEQIEEFQDAQMNIVNDKVAKRDADLLEMALHLEEKFYPHLLTTISGRRWLLTHDLKLAVVKCLNSHEYLSALGAAISRAIEKGMHDGLSVGIDHGKVRRSLVDIVGYNPAAKEVYKLALQMLRESVGRSSADMLRKDLKPDVEQLTLPIHRPEDQVVLGETSRSFTLSVTHSRVERIRENVAAQRSALIDVWVPLVGPLSAKNLVGEASTSDSLPAAVVTTTALSTTFATASSVPPITIEDYEIVGTDGPEDAQGNGQGNVASFPTVDITTVKFRNIFK
ncbi:hypothetical protein Tco_1272454 [Tanacetum coccineum]